MNAARPSVALVMPAHAPGPTLAAALAAIARLDPTPDQFVVVNDGDHDGVRQQCDASTADSVLGIGRSGPAAARNAGVGATTSDIIVFIDSDVVVASDLIGEIVTAMTADTAPDAIIGSYDDRPLATSTVSQFRNLLHHWTHQRGRRRATTFWGACGAVRRSAFDAVSGFDESFGDATIEDIELGQRLNAAGFDIELHPEIQVKHLKRWTLTSMVHTDVAKRGVPWARLILASGTIPDDLNTTRAARVTVGLSGCFAAAVCLTPFAGSGRRPRFGALTLLLAVWLTWRDRAVLGFFARCRSVGFAARCVPLLWVHHVSAGVSFAWALVTRQVAGGGAARVDRSE